MQSYQRLYLRISNSKTTEMSQGKVGRVTFFLFISTNVWIIPQIYLLFLDNSFVILFMFTFKSSKKKRGIFYYFIFCFTFISVKFAKTSRVYGHTLLLENAKWKIKRNFRFFNLLFMNFVIVFLTFFFCSRSKFVFIINWFSF